MAKCQYCGKYMLKSDGCDTDQLILNDGKTYNEQYRVDCAHKRVKHKNSESNVITQCQSLINRTDHALHHRQCRCRKTG